MSFHSLLLLSTLITFTPPAGAQALKPDDVLIAKRRTIDEESTQGIRTGSLVFSQGFNLNLIHDDNLYRTQNNTVSDVIAQVKPGFAVETSWKRHGVFLGVNGDLKYHRSEGSEDSKGYGTMLSGHYDIAEQTWLMAAITRLKRQEPRGSVLQDTNRQLDYTLTTKILEFTRALSYIKLKILGQDEHTSLSKDENPALAGANDYRSRDNRKIKGTISYEYMPLNEVFLTTSYDKTSYAFINGGSRNSDGTDIRIGWNFDNARTLNTSLYGGYVMRKYKTGTDDTRQPYMGASLTWNATPLTSFSFLVDRLFTDAVVAGASGAFKTTRKFSVRHDFTNLLSAELMAGIDDFDYTGGFSGSTRLYYTGASADYEIARGLGLRAGYDYTQRSDSEAFDKYKDNRFMLSLVFMY